MAETDDELVVPLVWRSPEGVEVTKRYVSIAAVMPSTCSTRCATTAVLDWQGRQYRQLQRTQVAETGQSTFIYTYMGGVIYSPEEKYEKIKFDDMVEANLDRTITDGWAAMLQHYFLGALIPARGEAERYYTKTLSNARYVIGMISPTQTVAAGEHGSVRNPDFIGPKLQDEMKQVAPGWS